ncbi:MAG TPA: hypothetical protein VGH15_12920 [Caulobacteraceae bacterium]|jgi:hypothetical protein
MTLHWGQSLACGVHGQPARSATTHGHKTFGSGVKSMKPENVFGLNHTTRPGTTTVAHLAEDDNYAWSDRIPAGETSITQSLDRMSVLAAASGVPDDDNIWFGSAPARGAMRMSLLTPDAKNWRNVVDHVSAFAALAREAGATPIVRDFVFTQGQVDVLLHTEFSQYRAQLLQIVDEADRLARNVTGQAEPVMTFINQVSHGIARKGGDIAQAQLEATFADSRAKLLIPDYVLPHSRDGLHLSSEGYALRGVYEARAKFWTFFCDGQGAVTGIRPLSACWAEGRFYVRFEAPTPPLRIGLEDIVVGAPDWKATRQHGFRAFDPDGDIALGDFQIGRDGVTLSCAGERAPGCGCVFRGGMDYQSQSNRGVTQGGACTDLKDSTNEVVSFGDGATLFRTWYPCPHFSLAVQSTSEDQSSSGRASFASVAGGPGAAKDHAALFPAEFSMLGKSLAF